MERTGDETGLAEGAEDVVVSAAVAGADADASAATDTGTDALVGSTDMGVAIGAIVFGEITEAWGAIFCS